MDNELLLILLEDVIIAVSLVVTVLIYYFSRREDRKLRRAAYVRDYTFSFAQRPEFETIFLDIDYNRFEWDDEHDGGTIKELHLMKLLDFFNSLGFSCSQGVISVSDIDETSLGYAMWTVYNNCEVQEYLKRVDAHDNLTAPIAFGHFRELGEKLKPIYQPGSADSPKDKDDGKPCDQNT